MCEDAPCCGCCGPDGEWEDFFPEVEPDEFDYALEYDEG